MRNISLDMLVNNEEFSLKHAEYQPRKRGPSSPTSSSMKEHLGSTSCGTIFDSGTAISARACDESVMAATRVSSETFRPAPARAVCKSRSRKVAVATARTNFGAEWGERIRRRVHGCHDSGLRLQMQEAYPDFSLSAMTLWRLVKGLGFSYKIVKGQRFIFERLDLARKRSLYLRNDEARTRRYCVVYMDEKWVFKGMVKRRGWVDNTVSRFPSRKAIQHYSCGKTAGKNKGRRGIVITALCEEGVITGSTHVLVSGHRTAQSDFQREMFEHSVRGMAGIEFAAGRNITLLLDNAPYYTRALEKVRVKEIRKLQNIKLVSSDSDQTLHNTGDYQLSQLARVEVAADST
ncbi:hypothetical protein COOONC_00394 [Cooperia oncophora]